MRHNRTLRKFSRTQAHRNMMYRNLVTSLFKHERIQTTAPKAKEARAVAERLITFAKKGDLHSRRIAARKVNEPVVLQKLFAEIGPRYAERPGGYTRILRVGPRLGDNAELVILELVDGTARPKVKDSRKRARARKVLQAEQKKEAIASFTEQAQEAADREKDKAADEDKK
jgi:large subunit ribosomal protein L17